MKKKLCIAAIALCCSLLTACAGENGANDSTQTDAMEVTTTEQEEETTIESITTKEEEVVQVGGKVVKEVIDSENIAKNLIGESSERNVYVYLPKSYSDDGKAMPVIYYLDGLDDDAKIFIDRAKLQLDNIFDGTKDEFIVVAMDGNMETGGSFYVNSPSTGNWEDFIAEELVAYIDGKYNTIANRDSRCITGFSMGGFGAVTIALNRPDVFGSLMALAPGIYADGNLKAMWDSWNGWNDVKLSYGQAFSPNNDPDKNFGNVPKFSGTDEDNAILEQWDSGYGCWEKKINEYINRGTFLNGIQISYSESDSFNWIPSGCKFFRDVLEQNNIECDFTTFSGGHAPPVSVFSNYFVPFAEKYIAFE